MCSCLARVDCNFKHFMSSLAKNVSRRKFTLKIIYSRVMCNLRDLYHRSSKFTPLSPSEDDDEEYGEPGRRQFVINDSEVSMKTRLSPFIHHDPCLSIENRPSR